MTKYILHALLLNAQECADPEIYMAEIGGSLPAEYYSDDGDADRAVRILTDLWNLSRDFTFRAIRKYSGLTQREFSDEYGIPVRSVENWDTGKREPPPYVLELLLCDIINGKNAEEI